MTQVQTIITTRRVLVENIAVRIIWFLFSIVEIILFVRLLLKLLGANTSADFTQFIYSLSAPFVAPFQSIIRSSAQGNSVIEWNAIIALFVYWFIAWALSQIFYRLEPATLATDQVQVVKKVKREEI